MWWMVGLAALVSAGVGAWRTRGADARQRAIMLACWRSGLRFAVLNPFPDLMWLPFPIFANARRPRVTNVVWDRRDEAVRAFDLALAATATEGDPGLGLGDTISMTCAVAPLPFDAPGLSVVARGATDPSGLPLEGSEVHLELDVFDRRFLVTSTDARAATAFLDQRMMQALLHLPVRASIHVRERTLLLVAPPRGSAGEVLLLVQTAKILARSVPRVTASLYPPRAEEGPYEDRWFQGRWSPEPTGSEAADAG
jgi:hypothetical protein